MSVLVRDDDILMVLRPLRLSSDELLAVEAFVQGARQWDLSPDDPLAVLSGQKRRLAVAVRAAGGGLVSYETLCALLGEDHGPDHVKVVICLARKASTECAARLLTVWGEGFRWKVDT